MRNPINKEHIEGRVFDFDLTEKTVENAQSKFYGKNFISGTVDVATDDAGLNVVQIHYVFVQPQTSTGKTNSTYTALKEIMTNGKTVAKDGFENATMVKADPSLALNDFYTDRTGEWQLVSAKRNQGGFISIVKSLNTTEDKRSTFECDMLINGTTYVEADPEKNIDHDYLVIKGAVFAYNKAILPVEFTCEAPDGIKYFESLDASPANPTFTKVWGIISSETIVTRKEEASAFGAPTVKEFTKTVKKYLVTGTSNPDAAYATDDEKNGITEAEVKKALTDRETYLAEEKKRAEDYKAQRASNTPAATATAAPAAAGGFNF
jgi:hypothetical protein